MKKMYKIAGILILFFSILSVRTYSQALSGAVTINQGAPTQGNNYNNFNDFANDINSNGISGPVEVNVVPFSGPYVEQVQFTEISGASAANRIMILGNDNLITFNSTNSGMPWTIALNGADYFTFKELNVEATGSTYAFALKLWNNANHNIISSCTFSVPANNTGTSGIPISISGSGNNYGSSGPGANYTLIENCTTFSGYVGIGIYGDGSTDQGTTNSFLKGNRIIGCTVLDFYSSGIWVNYYNQGTEVKNNIIKCPTRTNYTTKYGVYNYYNNGTIIEGNRISDLYGPGLQNATGTAYGIYAQYNWDSYGQGWSIPTRYPIIVRNNLITDINFNGTLYGIRFYYADGEVYNNTISLDYPNSTGGTTYGIYSAGNTSYLSNVTNNIITISRGGSGTKYGWYATGSADAGNKGDYNDIYMNAPQGTNYVGYYTSAAQTFSQFIAQGINQNGWSVDPLYANPANQDYHPTEVTINNQAIPKGLVFDVMGAIRNPQTPDIGALEFLTPNCNGAPNNFVSGASYALCPGETADLGIGIFNPDAGFTYQWQVSTLSQVGPWTPINGANGIFYTTPPVNQNAWYSVVITCTNPGGGVATPVATVQVAGTTTNSVYYLEDFEGIGKDNRLPNCSWTSPSIGGSTKTYTSSQTGNRLPYSGSSFATFEAGGGGTYYYYSNGIWLDPGITYSAALKYQTDFTGANNWTNLSILTGTSQSSNGLVPIASTNGAAISPIYKTLGNTFTVASSGIYYVAVRANASSGAAEYLSWDDLEISIPCTSILNPVNITMNPSATNVCSGSAINVTASGGDTYLWNNGATSAAISFTPSGTGPLEVTGTSMLTGCKGTASVLITVKESPNVSINAIPPVACAGQPINLVAGGASTYTWSSGGNGQIISVSPVASMGYTVLGSQGGCNAKASLFVTVHQLPTISAFASSPVICVGEPVIITATGAQTYQWFSSSSSVMFQGMNITDKPPIGQTTYTVYGTDANGCKGTVTSNVIVDECAGIAKLSGASGNVSLYPNPTNGVFDVVSANLEEMKVVVSDISGRKLLDAAGSEKVQVDISAFASGVYYIHVSGDSGVNVIKLIKE